MKYCFIVFFIISSLLIYSCASPKPPTQNDKYDCNVTGKAGDRGVLCANPTVPKNFEGSYCVPELATRFGKKTMVFTCIKKKKKKGKGENYLESYLFCAPKIEKIAGKKIMAFVCK